MTDLLKDVELDSFIVILFLGIIALLSLIPGAQTTNDLTKQIVGGMIGWLGKGAYSYAKAKLSTKS